MAAALILLAAGRMEGAGAAALGQRVGAAAARATQGAVM
jgi:hypothetical protein